MTITPFVAAKKITTEKRTTSIKKLRAEMGDVK